ncbi:SAM-dependent methyltransferase [Gloeocapsopsis sp. IPPAS B-1203]|uniref:SAM-dependent methyltransferase n=1 Tax=Gloeocapsopsis sp. IPPAS B-1203 TaxID=2049454 RepID=UPI000C187737|nr:SAM-dependent methyltransferase [Gloeocapsopsis sp. IPPAS B-1203]PIG93048.1 SAM-dependent methyltransferase [Gloeocapsopsis sp. IPPAS B-1203]
MTQYQQLDSKAFISLSARLAAAMRSQETARCDRIFNDPFATQLVSAEAFAFLAQRKIKPEEEGRPYVVVRTRFFDNFLLAKQTPQVVILASGMDTRAFRLPWLVNTKVYELDQSEVLSYKNAVLKDVLSTCQRCAIAADLTQPWSHLPLLQGYRPNIPSIWLIEGLLMYLNLDQVDMLTTVSQLAVTGSWLGLDVINTRAIQSATDSDFRGYWRSGFDNPEALLANYGWKANVIQPGDEGAHFGRYTCKLPPRDVPNVERVFLVTAQKLPLLAAE